MISDFCPIGVISGTALCDDFSNPAVPQWTTVGGGCVTTDPDRPGKGVRLAQPAGGGSCFLVHPPPAPTLPIDGDRFCMCFRLRVADGVARPDPLAPSYLVVLSGNTVGDQILLVLAAGQATWLITTSVTGPPLASAILSTAPDPTVFHTFRFCVVEDELTVHIDGSQVLEVPHNFASEDYQVLIQASASAAFGSDLRVDEFCLRSR